MGFFLAVREVSCDLIYRADFEVRPQEPVEADSPELAAGVEPGESASTGS